MLLGNETKIITGHFIAEAKRNGELRHLLPPGGTNDELPVQIHIILPHNPKGHQVLQEGVHVWSLHVLDSTALLQARLPPLRYLLRTFLHRLYALATACTPSDARSDGSKPYKSTHVWPPKKIGRAHV